MSKDLNFGVLLDFYGNILSPRQLDIMELYYNDDLSLAEISEDIGITRQGVRDAIKKSEQILIKTEENLELAKRFNLIKNQLECVKNKIRSREDPDIIIKMIDDINI